MGASVGASFCMCMCVYLYECVRVSISSEDSGPIDLHKMLAELGQTKDEIISR